MGTALVLPARFAPVTLRWRGTWFWAIVRKVCVSSQKRVFRVGKWPHTPHLVERGMFRWRLSSKMLMPGSVTQLSMMRMWRAGKLNRLGDATWR